MRKYIDILTETYHGEHRAPNREDGAPLYDLTLNGIYPDDVYSPRGREHDAHSHDSDGFYSAMQSRGRPNKFVTIYRAMPRDVRPLKINPGDWVTLSQDYAKQHGISNLSGYRVVKMTVAARDLFTDGNSLDEWGYDPQPSVPTAQEDEIRARLGMETKTAARARIAAEKAAK